MVVSCGKACSKIFSCPLESCCCISNVSLHNTALLCRNTLFPFTNRGMHFIVYLEEKDTIEGKTRALSYAALLERVHFFPSAQTTHKYWEYILISNLMCDIW